MLIECVPNFSEGRDTNVIAEIAATISSVKGIDLRHITADTDHNRSVITFFGEPECVMEAAFKATEVAAKLIDMTKHEGVHPFMGATDVIPLIPIEGVSMRQCIGFSKKLAQRIGEEIGIPVFLYANSATTEDQKKLEFVRKNYKNLSSDFGPLEAGRAGATAVGAREILIAFNVNLNSNDVKAAQKIAKKIRHSTGGLPHLKALGLKLEDQNCVQVSMNLTNYKVTSPLTAYRAAEKEAEKLGIKIKESELIGLIPKEALPETYEKTLKVNISKNQIF